MPKCDFNNVVLQLYLLRHEFSPVKLLHFFRTPLLRTPLVSCFCIDEERSILDFCGSPGYGSIQLKLVISYKRYTFLERFLHHLKLFL